MAIIHPTQNQLAIQSLHKWVEKVASNANTTELDALELTQLQRMLGTLIGTYKTNKSFISVPETGIHISEAITGNINLLLLVLEDDEGALSLPPVTIDPWIEHKLSFAISLIPAPEMTFAEGTALVYDLIQILYPQFQTTLNDSTVNKYLKEIGTLPYLFDFTYLVTIDFSTGEHTIDVRMATGLPKVEVPGISPVDMSAITATGVTLESSYIFDDEDDITEVGFEYGVDDDSMTEAAALLTESPFTVTIETMTANTQYYVTPYVKYGDDKMQRGLTAVFTTLET